MSSTLRYPPTRQFPADKRQVKFLRSQIPQFLNAIRILKIGFPRDTHVQRFRERFGMMYEDYRVEYPVPALNFREVLLDRDLDWDGKYLGKVEEVREVSEFCRPHRDNQLDYSTFQNYERWFFTHVRIPDHAVKLPSYSSAVWEYQYAGIGIKPKDPVKRRRSFPIKRKARGRRAKGNSQIASTGPRASTEPSRPAKMTDFVIEAPRSPLATLSGPSSSTLGEPFSDGDFILVKDSDDEGSLELQYPL
jgi:hypothetical protein